MGHPFSSFIGRQVPSGHQKDPVHVATKVMNQQDLKVIIGRNIIRTSLILVLICTAIPFWVLWQDRTEKGTFDVSIWWLQAPIDDKDLELLKEEKREIDGVQGSGGLDILLNGHSSNFLKRDANSISSSAASEVKLSKWAKDQLSIARLYSGSLTRGSFCASILSIKQMQIKASNWLASHREDFSNTATVGSPTTTTIGIDNNHNSHHHLTATTRGNADIGEPFIWDATLGSSGAIIYILFSVINPPDKIMGMGNRNNTSSSGSYSSIGGSGSGSSNSDSSQRHGISSLHDNTKNKIYYEKYGITGSSDKNSRLPTDLYSRVTCRLYDHRSQILATVPSLPIIGYGRDRDRDTGAGMIGNTASNNGVSVSYRILRCPVPPQLRKEEKFLTRIIWSPSNTATHTNSGSGSSGNSNSQHSHSAHGFTGGNSSRMASKAAPLYSVCPLSTIATSSSSSSLATLTAPHPQYATTLVGVSITNNLRGTKSHYSHQVNNRNNSVNSSVTDFYPPVPLEGWSAAERKKVITPSPLVSPGLALFPDELTNLEHLPKHNYAMSVCTATSRGRIHPGSLSEGIRDDPKKYYSLILHQKQLLIEWLEYHRAIGVEHFFMFDTFTEQMSAMEQQANQTYARMKVKIDKSMNNNATSPNFGGKMGLRSVLSEYIAMGLVTVVSWPYAECDGSQTRRQKESTAMRNRGGEGRTDNDDETQGSTASKQSKTTRTSTCFDANGRYQERNFIPQAPLHSAAVQACYARFRSSSRWMAVLNVDEFIGIDVSKPYIRTGTYGLGSGVGSGIGQSRRTDTDRRGSSAGAGDGVSNGAMNNNGKTSYSSSSPSSSSSYFDLPSMLSALERSHRNLAAVELQAMAYLPCDRIRDNNNNNNNSNGDRDRYIGRNMNIKENKNGKTETLAKTEGETTDMDMWKRRAGVLASESGTGSLNLLSRLGSMLSWRSKTTSDITDNADGNININAKEVESGEASGRQQQQVHTPHHLRSPGQVNGHNHHRHRRLLSTNEYISSFEYESRARLRSDEEDTPAAPRFGTYSYVLPILDPFTVSTEVDNVGSDGGAGAGVNTEQEGRMDVHGSVRRHRSKDSKTATTSTAVTSALGKERTMKRLLVRTDMVVMFDDQRGELIYVEAHSDYTSMYLTGSSGDNVRKGSIGAGSGIGTGSSGAGSSRNRYYRRQLLSSSSSSSSSAAGAGGANYQHQHQYQYQYQQYGGSVGLGDGHHAPGRREARRVTTNREAGDGEYRVIELTPENAAVMHFRVDPYPVTSNINSGSDGDSGDGYGSSSSSSFPSSSSSSSSSLSQQECPDLSLVSSYDVHDYPVKAPFVITTDSSSTVTEGTHIQETQRTDKEEKDKRVGYPYLHSTPLSLLCDAKSIPSVKTSVEVKYHTAYTERLEELLGDRFLRALQGLVPQGHGKFEVDDDA